MKTLIVLTASLALAGTALAGTSIGVLEPSPAGGTSAKTGVELVTDQAAVALQVDALFDDAKYKADSALDGAQPTGVLVQSRLVAPGQLRIVVYHRSGASISSDLLFQIPLTAKSGVVGDDPIVLANYIVSGQGGGALPIGLLPSVRLVNVKDGEQVNGRIGIELSSKAASTSAAVAKVDYYVGGQYVGTGTGTTFSFVWFPPTSGPFEVKAVAFDSKGQQGESRTIPITVQHVGTFAGAITGTYQGLIRTPTFDFAKNGYASLTSSTTGAFTAKLTLGGVLISTAGKFDANGIANVTIPKTTTRPAWQLTLTESSLASVSQIQGRLTDGTITGGRVTGSTFIANFTADKITWDGKLKKPAQAGAYTMILPASSLAAAQAAPLGDGFATASVTTTGVVSMAGKLADNTAWSQSTYLSKDGVWPLYALLYSSKGMAIGDMTFRNVTGVSDIDGTVDWFRPATVTTAVVPFKPGFHTQADAVGSHFVKPAANIRLMTTPNAGGNTQLTLQDGGLTSSLVDLGTLKTSHTFTVPYQSSEKPSLTVVSTTGALSGSFIHPFTQLATPFYGALLQKQNMGMGYFMSGLLSGGFSVEPNPQFTLAPKDSLAIGVVPLPVVKFVKPVAESTLPTAATIVISGTATPGTKKVLAAVEVQVLHNGVLTAPTAATGLASWTYNLTVPTGDGGRYQVFAKVRDTAGSESDILEQGFWVAKKSALIVSVSGPGSVTTGYLGTTQRDTDKLVTITATPASKKKFIGWTGSVVSSSAKITFMMKDGMSLTANFQ